MSEQQFTVDGVPVKRGDVVWRADACICVVRPRKLSKTDLGPWWDRVSKEIYSTEIAAVSAQLDRQKQNLAKARSAVCLAQKNIERMKRRLASASVQRATT